MTWFFDNVYRNSYTFDYGIKDVAKLDKNIYAVFAERLGDGVFKNDVALYTDKDTLYSHWDGSEKWKILLFETKNKVIAAEIDPRRKNMLDINFANNSYTVEKNYGASISLVLRWFFWVQNALLLLGSV